MDKISNQPKYNYGEVVQKSNLFYVAQRSGDLPDNNPIPWRGDSALNDGAEVGRDLTGGYYDAGDHVKFGLPMAYSMTMLSWGAEQYSEGYEKIGQLDETLENIKWGTDYILKAYDDKGTATTADDEFWGQVGDGNLDHAFWGAPEAMTMERPAFKVDAANPGSELTGENAAALASASIAFRGVDDAYADQLLDKAKQLYEFAETYQGKYSDAIENARNFYNSWSGYQDELAWGATWLHKAVEAAGSQEHEYLDKAESYYPGLNIGWTHNWDDKAHGTAVLLAQETGKAQYKGDVEAWLDNWADPNGGVKKTEGGLPFIAPWGSLRYSSTTAFLAGVYGDTVNDRGGKYTSFSENQINYILGDNPRKASYVVGFGENSPQNPHHRAASGASDAHNQDVEPTQHVLYGALVGGPKEANDFAYQDDRGDFIANEVTLDYNAAFQGAVARMTQKFGGQALTEIPGIDLNGTGVPGGNPGGNSGGNPGGNPGGSAPLVGDVDFSVRSEWDTGFTGKIEITNNGTQAINSWTLEFDASFEVKEIWGAQIGSQEGDRYFLNNADWNGFLAPGETVELGFNGSNSDNIKLVLNHVELNDVMIGTAGQPLVPESNIV